MQRISEGIMAGGQRVIAVIGGTSVRTVMIVVALLVTAVAVFFSYLAYSTRNLVTSLPEDVKQAVKQEDIQKVSESTKVQVTRSGTSSESHSVSKTQPRAANTNTQTETTVDINGSTTKLKNNQTFDKVIRTKDGSTSMKIHSSSNSRGNNESSLNVEIEYSTDSNKEVERSTTAQ